MRSTGIDAVFGFSQGAAVVTAILQPDVQQVLEVSAEGRPKGLSRRASSRHPTGLSRRASSLMDETSKSLGRLTNWFREKKPSNSMNETSKNVGRQQHWFKEVQLDFVMCAHGTDTTKIREAFCLTPEPPSNGVKVRSVHIIGPPHVTKGHRSASVHLAITLLPFGGL